MWRQLVRLDVNWCRYSSSILKNSISIFFYAVDTIYVFHLCVHVCLFGHFVNNSFDWSHLEISWHWPILMVTSLSFTSHIQNREPSVTMRGHARTLSLDFESKMARQKNNVMFLFLLMFSGLAESTSKLNPVVLGMYAIIFSREMSNRWNSLVELSKYHVTHDCASFPILSIS